MRTGVAPTLRGLGVTLMVVISGFSMSTTPAAAQPICVLNPVLGIVDTDSDGIASVAELEEFAKTADSTDLAAQAQALREEDVSGIQYRDCTPPSDESGGDSVSNGGGGDGEVGFVTPDPTECTVEPRDVESLLAISDAYESGSAIAPVPSEALATPGIQVPESEPADEETTEAATATIYELVACQNAEDVPRAYALYTDDVLIGLLAQGQQTDEERVAIFSKTPEARPPEEYASARVTDVRIVGDGNIIAVLEFREPSGSNDFYYKLVYRLVLEDDRYLIDGVVDTVTVPLGTPPA